MSPADVGLLYAEPPHDLVVYDLGRAGRIQLPLYYITKDEELPHLDLWLSTLKRYLIDTETSGLDPLTDQIATIQFGQPYCADPRAYVVDVRCVSFAAMQALLQKHLDRGAKKLGMNVRFECKFITQGFQVPVRDVEDIQVTEHVLRCGLFGAGDEQEGDDGEGRNRAAYRKTSMDALARFYLGITLDKDKKLRTSFFSTPPGKHDLRQRTYAAGDCVYPAPIARYQREELDARDLYNIARVEWEIIPVLAEAELRGMGIDQPAWRALWQEALEKLDQAQRKLDKLVLAVQGDLFENLLDDVRPLYLGGRKPVPLNYSSHEHVKWLIKRICKARNWPITIITEWDDLTYWKAHEVRKCVLGDPTAVTWLKRKVQEGKIQRPEDVPDWVLPESKYLILLKSDKDNLIIAECLNQLPRDLVDLLVEYSKYAKLVGTYGISFLNKNVRADTGRMHVEFHQCITNTGRLSTVPNSQNIPGDKRYRACFVPRSGRKFCVADYSQVEPRITAYVSRDPVYVSTYQNHDDIYLTSAEAMLGERPDPETPEGKLQRQNSKQRVLSLAYRLGKGKFRRKLIIALRKEILAGLVPAPTFDEASKAYDRFFEVHSGLREYQERMTGYAMPTHEGQDGKLVPNPRKIWDAMLQAPVTWVEAPCGRKRFFPPDSNPFSEGPNVPPQSGSATMLKAAMGYIQREIDQRGWWEKVGLVNTVHDELVYESDADIAEEFALVLKNCMESAGNMINGDVPIVAEWPKHSKGVVDYWAKEWFEEEEAAA